MLNRLLSGSHDIYSMETLAAHLGLSTEELLLLDWDIDPSEGVIVINPDSPAELLSKIQNMVNFSVRIPSGFLR